ncbi:MAG: 3-oxoacyl-[acyl-carrier protein] reductase [Candidatus Hydrogenedentes bacterium]|nr:3-oxoacyl-[acyl-carrier protein] reductase [Candidatus Hydrogenedentota bacterium]
MKIDLSGKIVVVTGATGRLGEFISRTLGECGADVVVQYLENADKAGEICRDIEAMGARALAIQADVTDLGSVVAMRDRIAAELGHADIIVNNAVIQYPWVTVLDQAPEDYESQFRSCVLHNVYMAKAFVPAMIEKKAGRVIAINTECAMQCWPNQSAYVSGKRGMDGVLRVLAREVGPHQITVNQVAPGYMLSAKNPSDPVGDAEYVKGIPLRHRGEAQEIAYTVAFLASEYARFISGAYVPVCGGNVMPGI